MQCHGRRVIFLTHRVLSHSSNHSHPQASSLLQLLLEAGVGIQQMACPSISAAGSTRWGLVNHEVDEATYRAKCKELAVVVVEQMRSYVHGGHEVVGVASQDNARDRVFAEELHAAMQRASLDLPMVSVPELAKDEDIALATEQIQRLVTPA